MQSKPPAISLRLALSVILIGAGCLAGGLILGVMGILEPDKVALNLPTTPSPTVIVPTESHLFDIKIAPPPLSDTAQLHMMPEMEIAPTPTPTASKIPSLKASPTIPQVTTTPMPSQTPSASATLRPLPSASLSPSPTATLERTSPAWPTFEAQPVEMENFLRHQTPTPVLFIPEKITIPAINLDAPIVPVAWEAVEIQGELYGQWLVPEAFASGWHRESARLGDVGNTVLNGHHNAWGEVFGRLVDLQVGDVIILSSQGKVFRYQVVQTIILLERDQAIATRLENARWLLPSQDERVTLVTCWPHHDNSHRLVVIALPEHQVQHWLARQTFEDWNWQEP